MAMQFVSGYAVVDILHGDLEVRGFLEPPRRARAGLVHADYRVSVG
jgi:hypothetical protein